MIERIVSQRCRAKLQRSPEEAEQLRRRCNFIRRDLEVDRDSHVCYSARGARGVSRVVADEVFFSGEA